MQHKFLYLLFMNIRNILFVAILASLSLCSHASYAIEQNKKWGKPTIEEMNMTAYDPDPEADAVVLMQSCDVRYKMGSIYDVNHIYDVRVRIKVLKESGKRHGDIIIPYLDSSRDTEMTETFYEFEAAAYNLNEKGKVQATKVTSQMISDERVDENYKVRKVSIPQVREGTVIEYHYELFSPRFYHIYDYEMQSDIPVLYSRFHMEVPAVVLFNVDAPIKHPNVKCQVTQGKIEVESGNSFKPILCNTNIYDVEAHDMPALRGDDFVWNVSDFCAKVVCDLNATNFPNAGFQSRRTSWEEVDDLLLSQEEIGPRLNDKSKLEAQMQAAGITEITDEKERIGACIDLLAEHVAWDGDYDILPHSANEVLKKKSGTSADLNMMLINMLNSLGMKSNPVFMSTLQNGKLPLHPSAKALNTFIVAVETSSSVCYVDATDPCGSANVLRPSLYAPQARIVGKHRKGEWTDLSKLAQARKMQQMEGTLSADGTLRGQLSVSDQDNYAREQRLRYFAQQDSAAFVSSMQDSYSIDIHSMQMEGYDRYSKDVKTVIGFEKQVDVTADHIYLNPFVIHPVGESPFASESRNLPVQLPYLSTVTSTASIAIPDGYEVEELPRSFDISAPDKAISARMQCVAEEGTIRVNFRMTVKKLSFGSEQYAALKTVFDAAGQRADDMIVLRKK